MRLNKFIALATGVSRRQADNFINSQLIKVNGTVAKNGQIVTENDKVEYQDKFLTLPSLMTIVLNKPTGYVCSRSGQGSKTIYDLLPKNLHHLKSIGRLDKNSSGLLLLTNDGELSQKLTHPSYKKEKIYIVSVSPDLSQEHKDMIEVGVKLEDGISKLRLKKISDNPQKWQVTMHEGRNRQIRRTFSSLGYKVISLHRTNFGIYTIDNIQSGKFKKIN